MSANNPFRGMGAVFYKEVLHARRDSMAIFMALFVPILQMTILGFGIDTNIRQVPTIVLDENGQYESRQFIDRMRNSDIFKIVGYAKDDREMHDAIVGGRAHVGVKIPYDYSRQLLDKQQAQILVLIDGSDSTVAATATNVAAALGLDESLSRVLNNRQPLPVDVRPTMLFNPDSRSPNFFLPGLTAVLLLFVTTFLTAFSVVREKENGTLEQLFLTPVHPLGMLFGKMMPYLIIAFGELSIIVFLMRTAFRIPIHGSVLLLMLLSIPYLFVALSIGLLVSTRAESQREAMQLSMVTFLPTVFFSGYLFPGETIPLGLYLLSFFLPATSFLNITRGILLRGAGFIHLWRDALALTVMGTLLVIVAARRFLKRVIQT